MELGTVVRNALQLSSVLHSDLDCSLRCPSSLPLMVHRHISNDLKETALSMSLQGLPDSEIRELTRISEHSLKRLRKTYRETGKTSCGPFTEGRPCILSSMEVKVRHKFLKDSHLLKISPVSL